MIQAGKLRHLLGFQEKTQALDALNAPKDGDWSDEFAFEVPAEQVSMQSREYADALKRNSEITILFKIRYMPGLDADKYRIVFTPDPERDPDKVQMFDIDPPIDPDGKRRELLIAGREIK